jgi:hypothetical protein
MLLLELFIALFLLATCLLPLVNGTPLFFAKGVKQLNEIELQRLADLTYIELKTNLSSIIKWDDLARSMKEYPLPSTELTLNTMKPAAYTRSAKIWICKEFEGEDNTNYRLLGCNLYFSRKQQQHKFQYKFFVFKKEAVNINA